MDFNNYPCSIIKIWSIKLRAARTLGRKRKDLFTSIVDRMRQRAISLSNRFLSGAGKMVMLKSVLSSLLTYLMSCQHTFSFTRWQIYGFMDLWRVFVGYENIHQNYIFTPRPFLQWIFPSPSKIHRKLKPFFGPSFNFKINWI